MPNTATKKNASPHRLAYELAGDGTVAGPTIANATLLADAATGPLRDALNAVYADQAAMRAALLYGNPVRILIQLQTAVADVTATVNQIVADVDVDAVTATKPEVNVGMSDATGQVAVLTLEYVHTVPR